MPGLWKAWKATNRLPPLSTSPLGISPRTGEIPTFPQRRRRGRWKSGKPKAGFPLSHRPEYFSSQRKKTKPAGGLRPPPEAWRLGINPTSTEQLQGRSRPSGADFLQTRSTKGDIAQTPTFRLTPHWNRRAVSGSSPVGINFRFQAHSWIGKCWGRIGSSKMSPKGALLGQMKK